VRSDSFCRQNVQRLTGSSCNRGSFKRGFPLPLIEVQLEVMDSKVDSKGTEAEYRRVRNSSSPGS
jgi:hypothetical protein